MPEDRQSDMSGHCPHPEPYRRLFSRLNLVGGGGLHWLLELDRYCVDTDARHGRDEGDVLARHGTTRYKGHKSQS
eukprot:scaffold1233_cov395-Prasinococcus_capsulatus_cf.AAC.44